MPTEAYELVVSGVLAGQFVQNVMHVNVDNSGSTAPYAVSQDILGSLVSVVDFWTLWCNALPADYRITSVRCKRVLATGGPTAIMLAADLGSSIGARTGSIQTAQVNPLLIFITTIRPNRPGRVFLPGLSETDCDDMVYTSGLLSAFAALIAGFVNVFVLDTLTYNASFGIYRRAQSASDDITAGRVSPLIGTQRRRLKPV